MVCDICGKNPASCVVSVEGTELNACDSCARHGKVLRKLIVLQPVSKKDVKAIKKAKEFAEQKVQELFPKKNEKKLVCTIVEDFAKRIRSKREKLGLKHEELAKKLAIKESLLRNLETGRSVPSISLAEKIQRILNIVLIEQSEELVVEPQVKSSSSELTVGDMVRIKSRKNK